MGTAVYGGTFDPIHEGHLRLARQVYAEILVRVVRFVVAADPPHKSAQIGASADHRFRMVEIAVSNEPHFLADSRELARTGPSYTVDTLEELDREVAAEPLHFLIGADNLVDFPRWKNAARILELATLVVFPRPEIDADPASLASLGDPPNPPNILPALELPHASSEIRQRIKRGQSLENLVPKEVEHYITEHQPYTCS